MTFHKYKNTIAKGIAILLASMMILGALAPVVFADEGTGGSVEDNIDKEEETEGKDGEEDKEETPDEKEESALKWNIKPYPLSGEDHTTKPQDRYDWFNENTFFHDVGYNVKEMFYDTDQKEKRLFIKVEFAVDQGELVLPNMNNLYEGISITSEGSSVTMLDREFLNAISSMSTENEKTGKNDRQDFIDKYIFVRNGTDKRKATLYIPIRPLIPNMKYNVSVKNGVVEVDGVNPSRPKRISEEKNWFFYTMPIPSVTEEGILLQTVREDYDIDEPLIISGELFYSPNIEVYFNNIPAYMVKVRKEENTVHTNNSNMYLEVYLPRSRNKLEAGLYNITIENSRDHSKEIYGALSVVAQSKGDIPTEKTDLGAITAYGEVYDLNGGQVIRLDHKEPFREETLRKTLQRYILRSPIVEVSSHSNYRFLFGIPVDMGQYENYKVLRYNESSNIWEEQNGYSLSEVDQRVEMFGNSAGTYVVVERKY